MTIYLLSIKFKVHEVSKKQINEEVFMLKLGA